MSLVPWPKGHPFQPVPFGENTRALLDDLVARNPKECFPIDLEDIKKRIGFIEHMILSEPFIIDAVQIKDVFMETIEHFGFLGMYDHVLLYLDEQAMKLEDPI